jgi:SAM-dependent methyltransferase
VKDVIYKTAGRASLFFDRIRPFLVTRGMKRDKTQPFDKTGLVVNKIHPLEILWKRDEIIYAQYDSFAHSFWRAQEFSLFEKYRTYLHRPVLDFGCGDGSFASVLFKEVDYGVDNDPEALSQAIQFGIYNKLSQSHDAAIPLESDSILSVYSNSVLEHVSDLDGVLSEIFRIVKKDGIFIFTVPVIQFKYDLAKYFGNAESERINVEYHHKNLLSADDWKSLIEHHGFTIVVLKQFQPDWFTFWYRMFRLIGERGLGRIIPDIGVRIWTKYHLDIIDMIRMSVSETKKGANIFVIVRK